MTHSTDKAPILHLAGREDLVLDYDQLLPSVVSGRIAIYLVQLCDGQPTGQRIYLLTSHDGALLFGKPAEIDGSTFVLEACPIDSSDIETVDPLEFRQPQGRQRWVQLEDWIQSLCRVVSEDLKTVYTEKPNPEGQFQLAAGQSLRSASHDVQWLQLDEGQLQFLGLPDEAIEAGAAPIPVTGEVWLHADGEVRGRFVRGDQLDAVDRLVGAARCVQICIRQFCRYQQSRNAAEAKRLERLTEFEAAERRRAIDSLAVERRKDAVLFRPDEPLRTVLGVVGDEIHVDFQKQWHVCDTSQTHAQVLAALARAAGTRLRKVRLVGRWWKDDVGTLVAFKKEGGGPIALVCARRWWGLERHYEMVDPEVGGRRTIQPRDMPDTLADEAFTFVAPLPATKKTLSISELSQFSFRPFLPDMRLILIFSVLSGLFGLLMPYANRLMIDKAIPDANKNLVVQLAVGLSAMSLALFVFSLSQGLISLRVKTALTSRLQAAIIDRLLKLPLRFYRNFSSGDLLNRSMMINEISTGFSMTAVSALMSLLSTAMMLALCFYYSTRLALIALIAAIITSVISVTSSFFIRRRALRLEIESGILYGFVVQMIHGVSKLQIAGAESRAFHQWAERYGAQLQEQNAIALLQHRVGLVNMAVQTGSSAALYYFAGKMVQESARLQAVSPLLPPLLTIGMFFAFQSAFGTVVKGIASFFGTFVQIHQLMAKRDLVKPILEEPLEVGEGKTDPGRLSGRVCVADVIFRYDEGGPLILDGVSIEAYPGEFIALVGPSGSGKSTLLKLLLGFESSESGQVLIDGHDLSSLDMPAVRRQIGTVLQNGKLNAGPIFEVISGASQLTLEQAWQAAEDAGFADDIRNMSMQMHTMVPEGATTLSGGQRQRLLIARALAVNPRILLFDEATSALDNRTQKVVTDSLQRRKITRIVVAHRLSTIQDADRIYVLDSGRVVEKGKFDELMEAKGLFFELANRQLAHT